MKKEANYLMSLQGKVVRSSVVIFYLLIGLEIIIMISS